MDACWLYCTENFGFSKFNFRLSQDGFFLILNTTGVVKEISMILKRRNWLPGSVALVWMIVAGFQPLHLHCETLGHMQVVKLVDMNLELLQEYFSGMNDNVVLECSEGMNLPFNFTLQGEFLMLHTDEYKDCIRVLKTCYIRCKENNFIFSTDLQNWQEFSDFFSGSLSVGVDVNEGAPKINLNIELNQKQP